MRKAKQYYSLTVQECNGGGKLVRPVIPAIEIIKAELDLGIAITQGLHYSCKWSPTLRSWVITPRIVNDVDA